MILAGAYMYHEMVMGTAITQEFIDSTDLPHLHATQPDSICKGVIWWMAEIQIITVSVDSVICLYLP